MFSIFSSLSSPLSLWVRGCLCPSVAPMHTQASLWGSLSEDPLSQYLLG